MTRRLSGLLLLTSAFVCAVPAHAQKTINVPGDYLTIQMAVTAANTGDTVLVAPGTYPENVVISSKEITLEAAACQPVTSGCNTQTTIDAQKLGSAITVMFTTSLKTTITGFSLINAISGTSGSNAGVSLMEAGATVINNSFSGNAAGVSVINGSIDLVDNQINTVIPSAQCDVGSGIYLSGSSTVVDSAGNQDSIIGNTISTSAKCEGGTGIIAQQGGNLSISFNQITGTTMAITTFPPVAGSIDTISDNVIYGNTQGGLNITHSTDSPGTDPADTFVINNTFVNNLSAAKGVATAAEVYVSGTYSQVELINNIFSTNSSTNPVISCSAAASSSSNPTTPILLDHNLFYNPTGALGAGGCPVTTGTYGNLNVNPGFVSSTNFALGNGSPAIDAGNNSAPGVVPGATDITGAPRIQESTQTAGPVVDMGAYEFAGTTAGSANRLTMTSSAYYLIAGNSITLSALLQNEASVTTGVPVNSPNQAVKFYQNGVSIGVPITGSGGVATMGPITLATAGLYAFTAYYPGTVYPSFSPVIYVYVATTLNTTQSVLTLNPAMPAAGSPVTLTATVSVAPPGTSAGISGTLIFYIDGGALSSATVNSGTASEIVTLNAGSHTLTCAYSGNAIDNGSSCNTVNVTVPVPPMAIKLSSNANPAPALSNVTFTAALTISGQAAGAGDSIAFNITGPQTLTATVATNAAGVATYSTSALTPGLYTVIASYAVNGNTTSTTYMQAVAVNATTTTLIAAPNPGAQNNPITLLANVAASTGTAAPIGSVTFIDGSTVLATLPVTPAAGTLASASLTISTLAPGTHMLTANYTPTGTSFLPSGSAVLTLPIAAQDFTLTANPPSITIESQHHASMQLTLTSIGGFSGLMSVQCSPPIPSYVTCELPPNVSLPANGTVPFTLTIDTDALLNFMAGQSAARAGLAMLAPLLLAGFVRRRKGLRTLLVLLAMVAPFTLLSGCSGKQPGHATPGVYTLAVMATGTAQGSSIATTHTLNITLTVTQ